MNDLVSRQAAIEAIKEDKIDLDDPKVVALFKATMNFVKAETQVMTCDRHIKILKDLPSAQSEDYAHGFADGYAQGKKDAQPERKMGRITYTHFSEELWGKSAICILCGCKWQIAEEGEDNFCPNCGSDMRGEE